MPGLQARTSPLSPEERARIATTVEAVVAKRKRREREWIKQMRDALAARKLDHDGFVRPEGGPSLNIIVSPDRVERALLLFQLLFDCAEELGVGIATKPDGTFAGIVPFDETLQVEIRERRRINKARQQARAAVRAGGRRTLGLYGVDEGPYLIPSGELSLGISRDRTGYTVTSWDSDGRSPEEVLKPLFWDLLDYPSRRAAQLEQKARRDAHEEEVRRIREAHNAEWAERKRIRDFMADPFKAWQEAESRREFLAIVRRAAERDGIPVGDTEFGRWLGRQEAKADELDPIAAILDIARSGAPIP